MSKLFYPRCRAVLQVIFDGFGPSARDTPPKIIPVLPVSCTVHKNSYKQADSWELTLDARDLDIDPELIRGGAIEIFIYQAPGIVGDQRVLDRKMDPATAAAFGKLRDAGDVAKLEKKDQQTIRRFTLNNKPVVAGLFDEAGLEMSASGRQVTLQGQDYTDHFIKMQYPPDRKGRARRIPTGFRLDFILEKLLQAADPTGRFKLVTRGIERHPSGLWAITPIVGANEVRNNKRGIPVDSSTSYWDVMYKLAIRYGLILFVDGLEVVLSRPQHITRKDDPRIRKFVWGKNIEQLDLRRKLAKEKTPQIIVRGYDEKTKKHIDERFPEKDDQVPTGIDVKQNEYLFIPAYGISDRKVFKQMAENFFNMIGQAERTVTMNTHDLKDMREDDLLNLAAGDAIEIRFDPFHRELLKKKEIGQAEKIQYLVDRGYGQSIAETIAEHFQKLAAIERPLRVREVSYDFSTTDGISIEIEAVDFIVMEGLRA